MCGGVAGDGFNFSGKFGSAGAEISGAVCKLRLPGNFGRWTLDFGLLPRMKREQCFFHGLRDEFSDFKLAVEFHLALGGMDVHVHGGGINFEKQAANRVTAFHQRVVIAFDERVIDAAIFHGTPIHENKLAITRRARDAGRADQTPDLNL